MNIVIISAVTSGIKKVLVSLMAQKAEIRYDPAYIMPSQIANKVTEIGYNSVVVENEEEEDGTVELLVCIKYMERPPH